MERGVTMRCTDCTKFVGSELVVEAEDADVSEEQEELVVSGEVRLVLQCSECSGELAESQQEYRETVGFGHKVEGCDGEVEIESTEATEMDRFDGKGRGAKHYYGADIVVVLGCNKCGQMVECYFKVEEQASCFNILN